MNLFSLFDQHKINYEAHKRDLYYKNISPQLFVSDSSIPAFYDISVIIPVRGRLDFQAPVYNHLKEAASKSNLNIAITFVEHAHLPEHLRSCQAGYIWVPCEKDSRFNKCLAFNIGFLYGPKAAYYLFFDGDLLCDNNFFKDLWNIAWNNPIQTFKGRRVVYADETLTKSFVSGGNIFNSIHVVSCLNITTGVPGAPGGSLFVSRDQFLQVGGYDAEFFTEYSIEDQFFFDKLSLFNSVKSLDTVELLHLYHGNSHAKTKDFDMNIFKTWRALSGEEKKRLVEMKSVHFKSFVI